MVMSNKTAARTPCLFIFDGRAEGVSDPALSMFTEKLLEAISVADPEGQLVAELKGGLPNLSNFAAQVSGVTSAPNRFQYHQIHDMALFRLLLWDMSEALGEASGAPRSRAILDVLRLGREECLALSDLPAGMRERCDRQLRSCPGYVGSCLLDVGNPIQRQAFYEGLSHFALIKGGWVVLERGFDGEPDFEPRGARAFRPHGMRLVPFGDKMLADPIFRVRRGPMSERGALSVDRLRRKTRTTVEGRVFHALIDASWTDRKGQEYSFIIAEAGRDVLEAILPEGKFTHYLFDRSHPKGKGKAGFIIDELGFEPEDWRYLAAQLYDGLMLSDPRDLLVKRWEGGYGARFNSLVAVTSRKGKRGILRAGWLLEPGKLPKLATAVPDREDIGLVEPPPPAVLPPRLEYDEEWWSDLHALAFVAGQQAAAAVVPTPILLDDFEVVEEGEAGGAHVRIADARRGYARWLIDNGLGLQDEGGAIIFARVASPSLERARSYAKAFARVLALNGIPSTFESYAFHELDQRRSSSKP